VVGEASAPSVGEGDHMVALSNSGGTAVTLHFARLAAQHVADLATATLVVPVTTSSQFGGLIVRAVRTHPARLDRPSSDGERPNMYRSMAARHANLE
jgi:hypothetical protein